MPNILKNIFSAGAEKLVSAVGKAFDENFTSKEEKEKAKLELLQEVNRNIEAMTKEANEIEKAYLLDTQNARGREAEFVKATGHVDWMQMAIGLIVMFSFIATVYFVATQPLPEGSEHLLINAMGILEGMVLAVVGYYYGSSAGSRAKDMRNK